MKASRAAPAVPLPPDPPQKVQLQTQRKEEESSLSGEPDLGFTHDREPGRVSCPSPTAAFQQISLEHSVATTIECANAQYQATRRRRGSVLAALPPVSRNQLRLELLHAGEFQEEEDKILCLQDSAEASHP